MVSGSASQASQRQMRWGAAVQQPGSCASGHLRWSGAAGCGGGDGGDSTSLPEDGGCAVGWRLDASPDASSTWHIVSCCLIQLIEVNFDWLTDLASHHRLQRRVVAARGASSSPVLPGPAGGGGLPSGLAFHLSNRS